VGDLGELAIVEAMPKQEGRNMIMVIGPNKRYLEDLAKQEARAAREAAKEAAALGSATDDAVAVDRLAEDALEPTAEDAAPLEPTAEAVAPAADEG
jgi:translation initiation factor IF-3